jgi:hypothetical protein
VITPEPSWKSFVESVAVSAPADDTTAVPSSIATALPNPSTGPPTPVTVSFFTLVCFTQPILLASLESTARNQPVTEPPAPFSLARPVTPSTTVFPPTAPAPTLNSLGSPPGVVVGVNTASSTHRPSEVVTTAEVSAEAADSEKTAEPSRASK